MANVELLRKKISESGMTVSAIADKSGILRETLYNRMKSGNFYASEIVSLTKVLRLSRKERDDIFLPWYVNAIHIRQINLKKEREYVIRK